MKKILIFIMVIIVLLVSGCSNLITKDNSGNLGLGKLDDMYSFYDYKTFLEAKDKIDSSSDIFYIDKSEEVKTSKVNNIETSLVFENVDIVREERDNIKISYIGIFDITSDKREPEYTINTNGSFTFKVKWGTVLGKSNAMMIIYLPNNYDGDLDVSSISGNINSRNLELNNIKFNNISGHINYSGIVAKDIELDTISGEIEGDNLKADKVDIKSISGNCITNDFTGKDIEIESTSGKIELNLDKQEGDIKVKTISGKVNLVIKGKLNTEIDISSLSGKVTCEYDFDEVYKKSDHKLLSKIGSGKYLIEVNSTSGNISLK